MSNGYGVDFYGIAYYGYSQPVDYSVAPFNSYQSDYGKISLRWSSPNVKPWKSMQLVRSIYGYPTTPVDGITVLTITPTQMATSFDDPNLATNTIYYYTMFLSLEAQTWNSANTYNILDVVLYNGLYWESTSNSNTNHIPSTSSAFWQNVQYQPIWFPAGYTASLTVANYGYASMLYNRTPQPYKISTSDIFANTVVDNPALFHYISVFSFGLDTTKTEYDLYLQGNNPDVISATNLDLLGQQFGFKTDYVSSPQSRRQRVKNIAVNYRLKGTTQGLHNAIASITGWDSTISYSPNMMQTLDQTSLYHPSYDLWNPATTYFPNQLIQFNGYNYKNLVQSYGQAQQPTGLGTSNTWWQVQLSTIASPILDTTTLANPVNFLAGSGGYSTWVPNNNNSFYNSALIQNGVVTGIQHPTNASINNWNALMYHAVASGGGVIANRSIGFPNTPTWSSGTNYVVNNWVTNGSGLYWIAKKPSGPGTPYGAITPGTNDQFWSPQFANSGTLPTLEIPTDGVPLIQGVQWNSSTQYPVGQRVVFFGIVYESINPNINSKPSGYYYSNANWIYIQPAEYIYTASAYQTRYTTLTNNSAFRIDMEYFDSQNNLQDFFDIQYTAYLSRFDGDYADLNGINDNTLANNPNYAWVANPSTPNLWRSTYGMAATDLSISGTTTYNTLILNDTPRTNPCIGITFVSDFKDNAHYSHGIVLNYQDANNFWYATRKTLYLVSGGVETAMATWTRLVDGDRMLIRKVNDVFFVYKYDRLGDNQTIGLAAITNATLDTATKCGLIQKYSASGAI